MNAGKKFLRILPGVGFAFVFALLAWYLGRIFPLIGGPVFGIIIGTCLSFASVPAAFASGIQYSSKTLLKVGIILLGFEMNMGSLLNVGGQSVIVMVSTISVCLFAAYITGKWLKISGNIPILIGIGTAICGGSAIAATSSVLDASDEDISYSMSTIFLFNIMAVFLFPLVGHLTAMSDNFFGMWTGTAVNDTSSVLAVGYSYSKAAGEYATIVKLARTLMIIPVTLLLSFAIAGKKAGALEFRLVKIFPWFVLGFVLASAFKTYAVLPDVVFNFLGNSGRFLIVAALTAIGLNTSFKQMRSAGLKPVLLGLCCWTAVSVSSVIIQMLTGIK